MATLELLPAGAPPPASALPASPPPPQAPPARDEVTVRAFPDNPDMREFTVNGARFTVVSTVKPSVRFQMYVLAGKDVANHMVMLTLTAVMMVTGKDGSGLAPPATPAQLSARLDMLGQPLLDYLMAEQLAKYSEMAPGVDENSGLKEVAKN